MIDQVSAGGPKQVGSQMNAAMKTLGNSDKADVVGTFNFVRYMELVAGFMAASMEVEIPKVDIQAKSSIAFAGRTTEAGSLELQIVMPKQHLLETKSVFQNVFSKIK